MVWKKGSISRIIKFDEKHTVRQEKESSRKEEICIFLFLYRPLSAGMSAEKRCEMCVKSQALHFIS
jgi:hypothetical protein